MATEWQPKNNNRLSVTKRVRKKVKIIFITGYPELQDSITALDIEIQDILLKPISSPEILRSIKKIFYP